MPLLSVYTDRWGQTHDEAWSYVSKAHFDFEVKSASFDIWIYTSKSDAYLGGRPPIDKISISLTPSGTPAVYSARTLVSPGVPAVWSEPAEDGSVTLISPAVDPVYSDPVQVLPAVPSFGEVLASNAVAYGTLEASLATLAKSVIPAFSEATWEAVDPVG